MSSRCRDEVLHARIYMAAIVIIQGGGGGPRGPNTLADWGRVGMGVARAQKATLQRVHCHLLRQEQAAVCLHTVSKLAGLQASVRSVVPFVQMMLDL